MYVTYVTKEDEIKDIQSKLLILEVQSGSDRNFSRARPFASHSINVLMLATSARTTSISTTSTHVFPSCPNSRVTI